MKITRRQLRKIITEAIVAGPEGAHRVEPEDRSPRVPVGRLTKDRFHGTAPKSHHVSPEVADIFDLDDPDQQEQAYDLSDTMQDYMPGTAQTARDDMKYSKQASELGLSPMYKVLKDIILPDGYKGFEFKSIDKYVEDDQGYNDFDTVYDYVILQNPSGDREVEFTLETPYNSKTPSPHIGIRIYKVENDEEFGFMRSVMDYTPVLFGLEKPEEIKRKLDKLIGRMK